MPVPDYVDLPPPVLLDAEYVGVLPGSPILADIQRYKQVVEEYRADQVREGEIVTKVIPSRIDRLFSKPLKTLYYTADGQAADPAVQLQAMQDKIAALEAEAVGYVSGEGYQKRVRRHEALTEVYNQLRERLARYKETLSSQKAVHLRLAAEEET